MTNPIQERQVELRTLTSADVGSFVRLIQEIPATKIRIEHRGVLVSFNETSIILSKHEDRILPGGEFGRRANSDIFGFELPPTNLINISSRRG